MRTSIPTLRNVQLRYNRPFRPKPNNFTPLGGGIYNPVQNPYNDPIPGATEVPNFRTPFHKAKLLNLPIG